MSKLLKNVPFDCGFGLKRDWPQARAGGLGQGSLPQAPVRRETKTPPRMPAAGPGGCIRLGRCQGRSLWIRRSDHHLHLPKAQFPSPSPYPDLSVPLPPHFHGPAGKVQALVFPANLEPPPLIDHCPLALHLPLLRPTQDSVQIARPRPMQVRGLRGPLPKPPVHRRQERLLQKRVGQLQIPARRSSFTSRS